MRSATRPEILATAALLAVLAGGCAAHQLELSREETDEILGEIDADVAQQRAAAKTAATKRVVREMAPEPVPAKVGLVDALRIAGRGNRDLIRSREGLVLSALALRNAQNDIGPRLAGTVGWALQGSDEAEEKTDANGSFSATATLPTGAQARVTGSAGRIAGVDGRLDTAVDQRIAATFSQPLLKRAGWEASHEALTDAERQALYDVRQFALSRQDLALDVQRAYYGLVTQLQVIRNREATLKNFEFLKKRSERLFEVDKVSEVDKFRAAREYLAAENELVDARSEYESRLDLFKVRLGLDTAVPLGIAEEIPKPKKLDIEMRKAVDTAITNRLELMTARDQVLDAERRERLREQDILPDLRVEVSGVRAGTGGGFSPSPLERDTWGVGMALELPLDRVRERGAYRSARIDLDRARRDLTLREDSVILEVREALRDQRSAESSLKIQEQIVVSEEKNVKIAQLRFERGEIGNRDLTEALTNLVDAKDRFAQEQANLEVARIQLLRALGILTMNEDGTWTE